MEVLIVLAVILPMCGFALAGIFLVCVSESKSWIFSPDYYENKRLKARIKELEDELKHQDGFFK